MKTNAVLSMLHQKVLVFVIFWGTQRGGNISPEPEKTDEHVSRFPSLPKPDGPGPFFSVAESRKFRELGTYS
jgi:hypothetical protein